MTGGHHVVDHDDRAIASLRFIGIATVEPEPIPSQADAMVVVPGLATVGAQHRTSAEWFASVAPGQQQLPAGQLKRSTGMLPRLRYILRPGPGSAVVERRILDEVVPWCADVRDQFICYRPGRVPALHS